MSATILTPVNLACTSSLAALTTAPATGKVRKYDIRVANVTTADAYVTLILTNGTTTINRAVNYPVPYESSGSAPDLESGVVIPAGWYFEAKSTGSSLVEVSAVGIEADATDFS